MTYLNNDHFQPDLQTLNELNDFDANITALPIHSHHAYAKALDAVKQEVHLAWLSTLPHDLRRIKDGATIIALDQERQADKPGTVRRPGIRRLTTKNHRKPRWASR